MIRLSKAEKSDSNSQLYLTILINAKLACIKDSDRKKDVQNALDKRLNTLANAVTHDEYAVDAAIQYLKEYLRDVLFKHYLDVIAINDFLYDLRTAFSVFKQNVILAGYRIMYEYTNYEGAN